MGSRFRVDFVFVQLAQLLPQNCCNRSFPAEKYFRFGGAFETLRVRFVAISIWKLFSFRENDSRFEGKIVFSRFPLCDKISLSFYLLTNSTQNPGLSELKKNKNKNYNNNKLKNRNEKKLHRLEIDFLNIR